MGQGGPRSTRPQGSSTTCSLCSRGTRRWTWWSRPPATPTSTCTTVEDTGICLGQALEEALGDRSGIARFASVAVPMDEALAEVSLDLSGRPFLVYNVTFPGERVGEFETELVEEFLQAFVNHARATLHVSVAYGTNDHHIAEAIFKGVARTLKAAVARDPRGGGIPSTKGVL